VPTGYQDDLAFGLDSVLGRPTLEGFELGADVV
jgi:hypothetical protein